MWPTTGKKDPILPPTTQKPEKKETTDAQKETVASKKETMINVDEQAQGFVTTRMTSQPRAIKIVFQTSETERYMHLNLKDLIDEGNCAIKPKEIKLAITNWNEDKVKEFKIGYTNIPLKDSIVSSWTENDFKRTYTSSSKMFSTSFGDIRCVWVNKDDKDVDAKHFHSISRGKQIKQADCETADEVIVYRGEDSPCSLGTMFFKLTRLYEGDVSICIDISLVYDKEDI